MRLFLLALLIFFAPELMAQDDLMEMLEEEIPDETTVTEAIFKGTRLIHGHSVKLRKKGELEFLIAHRFGRIDGGAYTFFGLDDAQMRMGFDYGVSDRINLGIGRSSLFKTYDGFAKVNLAQQRSGTSSFPVSVVAVTSIFIKTYPSSDIDPDISLTDRMAYSASLLIARKFSPALSIQIMPVWVHKNYVELPDVNDQLAIGSGLRYKVTPSVSLNLEYYYRIDPPQLADTYNSVALGVDIETGGHVFQLHLSNSRGMMERSFVTETVSNFADGDLHFGFNISRTFQLNKARTR